MEKFCFLEAYAAFTHEEVAQDIAYSYQVERPYVDRFHILVAYLSSPDYEESSYFLLLEKSTGDLYEVSGSHCSCYGFEGQFETEKTDITYLLSPHASFGGQSDEMKKRIQQFLVSKVRYLKLRELFEEV